MNKKRILCFLTIFILICGLSLSVASAKTVKKVTTVEDWEVPHNGVMDHTFFKISKGKPYKNGVVYGTNPMTNKVQKAPVYSKNYKISAKKNVKINKVVATSIGYPSGKYYKKTYYFSKTKLLKPDMYKSFWKFKVYYTVKK